MSGIQPEHADGWWTNHGLRQRFIARAVGAGGHLHLIEYDTHGSHTRQWVKTAELEFTRDVDVPEQPVADRAARKYRSYLESLDA